MRGRTSTRALEAQLTAPTDNLEDLKERLFEAEEIIKERDDRMALVDRIADLIGLPHDQELDQVAFELWFSENRAKLQTQSWQDMSTAPTNGKHCILAVQRGPFVYAIQGAFMSGKWMNAADIDAEPLCWMPNVLIPDEFLPWTDAYATTKSNGRNHE